MKYYFLIIRYTIKMYEKLPVEIEKKLPTKALQHIYLFLTPIPNCDHEKRIISNFCDMRMMLESMKENIEKLKMLNKR